MAADIEIKSTRHHGFGGWLGQEKPVIRGNSLSIFAKPAGTERLNVTRYSLSAGDASLTSDNALGPDTRADWS